MEYPDHHQPMLFFTAVSLLILSCFMFLTKHKKQTNKTIFEDPLWTFSGSGRGNILSMIWWVWLSVSVYLYCVCLCLIARRVFYAEKSIRLSSSLQCFHYTTFLQLDQQTNKKKYKTNKQQQLKKKTGGGRGIHRK